VRRRGRNHHRFEHECTTGFGWTAFDLVALDRLPRVKKEDRASARPKEVAQNFVARLKKKGEGHAKSVLQQMAKLMGMKVVEEGKG
jgi:hypothetical protein